MSVEVRLGTVSARWLGGALWLDHTGGGLLVDAPAGIAEALEAADGLATLRSVVVPSSRMRSLGGLLPLLHAVSAVRRSPLPLHVAHPLHVERVGIVADAWTRGWPDGVGVDLDAAMPDQDLELTGGFTVRFAPRAMAEPMLGRPQPVPGCAVSVEVGGQRIVFEPSARPSPRTARHARGADLAVVEVGRRPWPRSETPWRRTVAEAAAATEGAGRAWLVGDDGALLGDGDPDWA